MPAEAEPKAEHVYESNETLDKLKELSGQEMEEGEVWDTTGLEKHEREIEGFLEGSEFDQVMYSILMAIGVIFIMFSYVSTFYNERKYFNLTVIQDIIDKQLYRAD